MLFTCTLFIHEIGKPKHQFDWTGVRSHIKDTILRIAEYNDVSSYFVGYDAHVSPQYDRAKWFMNNAETYELKKLINYNNGAVKAYCFKSLLKRNDVELFDYIVQSYHDKTMVYTTSGCIGGEYTLFEFYIEEITPPHELGSTAASYKFDEKEKAVLNELIRRYNTKEDLMYKLGFLK